MKRRHFLRSTVLGGLGAAMPIPSLLANPAGDFVKLTILHTNDVHSRIDPFPEDGSSNAGKGGAARRAALIKQIRSEEENVLLLDSGDIFQGTPYFNFYGGELELKLMTEMKYDASTMGNHDFDAGIDGFHKQLKHADFPFVLCNYDFRDTILHDKVQPYVILSSGPLRIGVIGLGIELDGLVPPALYGDTRYRDPIEYGDQMAKELKKKEGVDLVICLSHLGYQYFSSKVDDIKLAQSTKYIDVILGGHTHTFLRHPTVLKNDADRPVLVNQAGWGGMALGRMDLYFSKNKYRGKMTASNLIIK